MLRATRWGGGTIRQRLEDLVLENYGSFDRFYLESVVIWSLNPLILPSWIAWCARTSGPASRGAVTTRTSAITT